MPLNTQEDSSVLHRHKAMTILPYMYTRISVLLRSETQGFALRPCAGSCPRQCTSSTSGVGQETVPGTYSSSQASRVCPVHCAPYTASIASTPPPHHHLTRSDFVVATQTLLARDPSACCCGVGVPCVSTTTPRRRPCILALYQSRTHRNSRAELVNISLWLACMVLRLTGA